MSSPESVTGITSPPSPSAGRIRFDGRPESAFTRRGLVTLLLMFTIVGIPWAYLRLLRWLARHTLLPDGRRFTFTGRVEGLWAYFAGATLVYLVCYRGIGGLTGTILGMLLSAILGAWIMRWLWSYFEVEGSPGTRVGMGLWPIAGWILLNSIAIYTLIGWAWVTTTLNRRMASSLSMPGLRFSFRMGGFEYLWRSLAYILFCMPVITLPWALTWAMGWFVHAFEVEPTTAARPPYVPEDPSSQPIA